MEAPFPPYRGSEPYVFVCYAHADKATVYPEIHRLHDRGANIWYDEGVTPGEEWTEELGQRITGAARLVFFVTPASVNSRHCRNEVHFALSRNVPVLTVHLQETELPDGLALSLGTAQAIIKHEVTEDAFRNKLTDALIPEGSPLTPSSTVPRRGSRAIPVVAATIAIGLAAVIAWWLVADDAVKQPPPSRSVQLHPIVSADPDGRLSTFAAALNDDLATLITGYPEIRTFTGGPASNASYQVHARVHAEGAQARVSVTLSRSDGTGSVWSEAYDADPAGNQAARTRLATIMARNLRLHLHRDHECEGIRHKTRDRAAADHVCAGLAEWYRYNPGRRAVALDPKLAEAHFLVAAHHRVDAWQQALADMETAVELEPDNPMLLYFFGHLHLDRLNYAAAEANFRLGIESDPLSIWAKWIHVGLGNIAIHRGDLQMAIEHYQRALRVFDADAILYADYAALMNALGRHAEALEAAETGLELVERGFPRVSLLLGKGFAHVQLGQTDLAELVVEEVVAATRVPPPSLLARLGRQAEATQVLVDMAARPQPPMDMLAFGHAALGNVDQAFEWIHRCLGRLIYPNFTIRYLRTYPAFSDLRADPRWEALMERLEALETDH